MVHRQLFSVVVALGGLLIACGSACAHPHVWVTIHSDLVYASDGSITGVHHAWTFDDMFSTFATQGIESKRKGEFTREELAPIADLTIGSEYANKIVVKCP
jgi:ABC-type uncharacterized transport system substrate-binding protein